MKYSKNVQLILDVLKDEAVGDVKAALSKVTDDYTMTWVYEGKDGSLFPKTENDLETEIEDVYQIKGREYDIRNIAEGENVVMIEMIESYPDPKTGQVYRTPQVIVLELKDNKIRTGRHYCDPRLSFKELSREQINLALRDTATKLKIKE